MAIFTRTLAADESKSGFFFATLIPGSTITLSADSAARADISIVNAPNFNAGIMLSVDNNEGGGGDAPGIGNGSTTWNVPANLTTTDGSDLRAIVTWTAYNWQGPGSITIDGFGMVDSETRHPDLEWADLFDGKVRRVLAFPPEGGEVELALKISDPELEFDCKQRHFGLGWTTEFEKYFSATIADKKLKIRVSEIPSDVMQGHGAFFGALKVKSGATSVNIEILADYVFPDRGIADYWQNTEIGLSAREWDATNTSASSAPRNLGFYPEDLPEGTVKLKVETNSITNSSEWIEADLQTREGLSREIELTGSNRKFSVVLDIGMNLSPLRRLAEVLITPDISPRSAIRLLCVQNPYNEQNEKPQITINPDMLEFDALGGEQSFEITSSTEAALVDLLINEDWITTAPGGGIRVAENTGEARTGTVIFLGPGPAEAHLTVIQKSAEESLAKVSISPTMLQFDAVGGSANIEIAATTSTGAVDVATDSSWITAFPSGSVLIEPNPGEARTGTVVFYGEFGGSAVLEVSQDAYTEDASIRVSPETLEFSSVGGMQHVDIVTSGNAGAVQISTEADWLTVDADANVIAGANSSTQAREARIEFRGGNMPAGTGASVTVTQAGARKLPAAFYRGTRAK